MENEARDLAIYLLRYVRGERLEKKDTLLRQKVVILALKQYCKEQYRMVATRWPPNAWIGGSLRYRCVQGKAQDGTSLLAGESKRSAAFGCHFRPSGKKDHQRRYPGIRDGIQFIELKIL